MDEIFEAGDTYESPFTSHDCIDIIVDGPGDTTVRPLTGERLKRAQAEWAKIQYWQAVERGEINPDVTPPPPYSPPSN
ncbi:MAG: hypothetical protein HY289_12035 [Planctomycetes bacterium]|nr:hypothetical protein [Planctomycetota bacterium]